MHSAASSGSLDVFVTGFFRLFGLATAALLLGGCASGPRVSIRPEEAHTGFVVRHQESVPVAFKQVELALAATYRDLPDIMKLKQPSTGIFILRPSINYQIDWVSGPVEHARYDLKILVTEGRVTLDFDLDLEQAPGWNSFPPEEEIPKIKASFRDFAGQVAKAVGGTLE